MLTQYLITNPTGTNDQLPQFVVTILRDYLSFIEKPKLFRICKKWTTIFSTALLWNHMEFKRNGNYFSIARLLRLLSHIDLRQCCNNSSLKKLQNNCPSFKLWIDNMLSKRYFSKVHSLSLSSSSFVEPSLNFFEPTLHQTSMILLQSQLQTLEIILTEITHTILSMVSEHLVELTIIIVNTTPIKSIQPTLNIMDRITELNNLFININKINFPKLRKLSFNYTYDDNVHNIYENIYNSIYPLLTAPNLSELVYYNKYYKYEYVEQIKNKYEKLTKLEIITPKNNVYDIKDDFNTQAMCNHINLKWSDNIIKSLYFGNIKIKEHSINISNDLLGSRVEKVTFNYANFVNYLKYLDIKLFSGITEIDMLCFDIEDNTILTYEIFEEIMIFINKIKQSHIKVNNYYIIVSDLLLDCGDKFLFDNRQYEESNDNLINLLNLCVKRSEINDRPRINNIGIYYDSGDLFAPTDELCENIFYQDVINATNSDVILDIYFYNPQFEDYNKDDDSLLNVCVEYDENLMIFDVNYLNRVRVAPLGKYTIRDFKMKIASIQYEYQNRTINFHLINCNLDHTHTNECDFKKINTIFSG